MNNEPYSKLKMDEYGSIRSDDTLTEKEGYEAMLHMLSAYRDLTESDDLTDILSGGEYWPGKDYIPADTAFWEYWLEAVAKVKRGDAPLRKTLYPAE